MEQAVTNPLGTDKIGRLLRGFAIPSIIAMLVSSLYNIVDQYFIGQSVGSLGNAATNIAFPLSISCIAAALMFGIGGSSAFNLALGEGDDDKAVYYIGNASVMMLSVGAVLCAVTEIFLEPLLMFFGSPDNVLGYAKSYTGITALGFPFLIFSAGGGHLIRADGRPRLTMVCNMVGAVVNTVLDALFVFAFGWGMEGAAAATIIGQVVSSLLVVWFLAHCRSVTLKLRHLKPSLKIIKHIASLGAAPCTNQLSMMLIQIIMNKSLKYYGSMSVYGEEIPIACVGIITKVSQLFFSFIIGLSQGLQPIVSFNYGAGKYGRVKNAYKLAVGCGFLLSLSAFLTFQIFPREIIAIFGEGSEEYFTFSVNYFRIYLFFTIINFIQPITSNFFTAIGKPTRGILLSLTRQIIYLLPLLIVLPLFFGIDGLIYAGPIADFLAAGTAFTLIFIELRQSIYHGAGTDGRRQV